MDGCKILVFEDTEDDATALFTAIFANAALSNWAPCLLWVQGPPAPISGDTLSAPDRVGPLVFDQNAKARWVRHQDGRLILEAVSPDARFWPEDFAAAVLDVWRGGEVGTPIGEIGYAHWLDLAGFFGPVVLVTRYHFGVRLLPLVPHRRLFQKDENPSWPESSAAFIAEILQLLETKKIMRTVGARGRSPASDSSLRGFFDHVRRLGSQPDDCTVLWVGEDDEACKRIAGSFDHKVKSKVRTLDDESVESSIKRVWFDIPQGLESSHLDTVKRLRQAGVMQPITLLCTSITIDQGQLDELTHHGAPILPRPLLLGDGGLRSWLDDVVRRFLVGYDLIRNFWGQTPDGDTGCRATLDLFATYLSLLTAARATKYILPHARRDASILSWASPYPSPLLPAQTSMANYLPKWWDILKKEETKGDKVKPPLISAETRKMVGR